jgi:phenylalanyl-tRNA synthetase beta chain
MSVMRSSLIGSLLQVVKFNSDRKADRVRVFELGRVFLRDESVQDTDTTVKGFHQPMRVAGMAWGPVEPTGWSGKSRLVDFYDVKADLQAILSPVQATFEVAEHPALHPGRSARVLIQGQAVGFVGELHPRWRQRWDLSSAPVVFELDLDAVLQRPVPVAQAVPRHQAVERDLAVIVAEKVTHAELMAAVWSAPSQGLLRDALLFDVYRPQTGKAPVGGLNEGEKSMAVRLTLNSDEATLTEAQIDAVMSAQIAHLMSQLNARLRA